MGCHEGVWIGLRHDPKCKPRLWNQLLIVALRKVLHVKAVTQCAVLEDFGIFLVLADKVSTLLGVQEADLQCRVCLLITWKLSSRVTLLLRCGPVRKS